MIQSVIRRATREKGEPLNILTFPTHERYESTLCETNHNFYSFQIQGGKEWKQEYAPLPQNYIIMPNGLLPDVDLDLVLCHNKTDGVYELAKGIGGRYYMPLICMTHVLPPRNRPQEELRRKRGHLNLYISEYSRDAWGDADSRVIEHGIDTDLFCPLQGATRWPQVFAAVNDWINRDSECGFTLWKHVTKDLPCFVLGDTPGLSRAAHNTAELIFSYQISRVFINTAEYSPVPMAMLEAMACGCAVVTTANPMTADIIRNGENGLITNNPSEMRMYLAALLNDPDYAERLGQAARQTILDRFSLDRHVKDWNNVFEEAASLPYVGEPV